MEAPQELSLPEIRNYMLANGCKVTNHALVKHFKRFLTHPQTQNEARKQFKTYVNILATIKNENNQKFLILRKKYLNECPAEEAVERAVAAAALDAAPSSPGGSSIFSESGLSSPAPFRQPPPYKPPPEVVGSSKSTDAPPAAVTTGITVHKENVESYRDCVNEFTAAMRRIDPARLARQSSTEEAQKEEEQDNTETIVSGMATATVDEMDAKQRPASISRANSVEDGKGGSSNKENIPRFSFSSGASATSTDSTSEDPPAASEGNGSGAENENPMSVKEATRKFNRMASEEEAKIISPPSKKKAEQQLLEEKDVPEVTLAHPKAKEWIVSMAKANYQELAKLANEFPELVKLQDPTTGYTALHWAAKHGNEDVVKLIAGTYKANVNARTNGGYTPLHLAMQFGKVNIFELLCNVYKANRDLMDWSGNKPLDYSKQRTTVSASTYSSEYYDLFTEPNNNYNFSGILAGNGFGGGAGTVGSALKRGKKRSHLRYATLSSATGSGLSSLSRTQSLMISRRHKKSQTNSVMLSAANELVTASPFPGTLVDSNNSDNNDEESAVELRNSVPPKDHSPVSSTTAPVRRKESFLRKTLRAAATVNKHNHDFVTNPTLAE